MGLKKIILAAARKSLCAGNGYRTLWIGGSCPQPDEIPKDEGANMPWKSLKHRLMHTMICRAILSSALYTFQVSK